jgi:CheY-like chemotaxis protein
MRQVLCDLLESAGHEVVEAADGLEGTRVALATQPDLIVLDLMMPMSAGTTVLDFRQDTPGLCDIPILVVSAHSDMAGISRRHGADAWLSKPVRLVELRRQVDELLSRRVQHLP